MFVAVKNYFLVGLPTLTFGSSGLVLAFLNHVHRPVTGQQNSYSAEPLLERTVSLVFFSYPLIFLSLLILLLHLLSYELTQAAISSDLMNNNDGRAMPDR